MATATDEIPTTSGTSTPAKRDGRKVQKKRKRGDDEPPTWFTTFALEQNKQLDDIRSLQEKMVEVAKDRNEILKQFVTALSMTKDNTK
jgi:hypothetical protein